MNNNIFYHSGAFGDIIYSIPFCLSCVGIYNSQQLEKNKYTLLLDLCCCHKPNGDYDIAYQNLKKVAQLMNIQPYIQQVICQKQISWGDYGALDLGIFRKGKINLVGGDISLRYNFLRRQLNYFNIYQPWLKVPQTDKFKQYKNKIVVFRTTRYRNHKIDYSLLKKYSSDCVYIGLQKQYSLFCIQNGFKVQFLKLDNFIQVCQLMKSCAFVVGNQTFLFSLAQALKVPRLLQMCYAQPDVIVHGNGSNDFVDMEDFQNLLKLYSNNYLE